MKAENVCGVGIVGAGVVGGGVVECLLKREDFFYKRSGVKIKLIKVATKIKDAKIDIDIPENLLTEDYKEVIENKNIDVVVELVGGTGIAYNIVSEALKAGKNVVTANKALLAEKGKELFELAEKNGKTIAFEASVAGGIPIILALREGLVANQVVGILGIVNGTCNYILTEMTQKKIPFAECLKQAQELGYAEANPAADIDGYDSGHKLALLSALAFESWVEFPKLHIEGIRNICDVDVKIAAELGYTLKLLAVAKTSEKAINDDGSVDKNAKLFLSVHPALLKNNHPLASVNGSLNAVELYGDTVGEAMFYGRGAGRFPTSSAVIADIIQLAKANKNKINESTWLPQKNNAYKIADSKDYVTRYYLRLMVKDCPGVLGKVTTCLGKFNVSIAAVRQFENESTNGYVPICLITHSAKEGDIQQALLEIENYDFLDAKPILIRIEG